MLTRLQALSAEIFHEDECKVIIGPRGAIKHECHTVRRNGGTQTWVRDPEAFRVPVKYGMRSTSDAYSSITRDNAHRYHVAQDCKPTVVDNRPGAQRDACPVCLMHFPDEQQCHAHIAEKHHPW